MKQYTKDPDADLEYGWKWADWLGEDTIASSDWGASDGITIITERSAFTDTITTVWLRGGEAGKSYLVTNRVTTAGGRVEDRTFRVHVEER